MSALPIPPGAPPAAHGRTERLDELSPAARQAVVRNRLFILALALAAVGIVLAGALFRLVPLKRTEPIIVERDTLTGAVKAIATTSEAYRPTQNDIKYFLHRWVMQVLSINRLTTERDIEEARTNFTRGKAVNQLDAYFDRERPIGRLRGDPGLTRKVEVSSVSIFKDGAVLKFSTVEQGSADREPRRTKMVATLQFSIVPPDDEKSIFANPAGLYITDLDFTRDLES